MTRRSLLLSTATSMAIGTASAKSPALPSPIGAIPSNRQLRWHEMEFYGFLHFTVNTFTDREWGEGDEDPSIFAPTNFDADAMMQGMAASGMKGVILTCKHHDGFCLWPTKTTDHCIRNSKWRGGQGDVVKEISRAAQRHGLKFGVYVSPWDRNSALYGTPEYVKLYRQQLTELLTNYGPIFEIWHDGANGGTGFYGGAREKRTIDKTRYYDWPNTWDLARSLQPEAVIFSDVGPDIRWVGNEKGRAGDPCWATYTPIGEKGGPASPGDVKVSENNSGTRNGARWMPAECDVSIRPGWFWHAKENEKVKTPAELLDLYYKSVGRGASFLLNVPPTREGQLHENDVASLRNFGELLKKTFAQNLAAHAKVTASSIRANRPSQFGPKHLLTADRSTYWAAEDGVITPEIVFDLHRPITFNLVRIREAIQFGQRIDGIALEHRTAGSWQSLATATSIGACRLIRLDSAVTTTQLRLRVTGSSAAPILSEVSFFTEAS